MLARLERRSYSQASQDRFVLGVLGFPVGGWYLDIGCSEPFNSNNTAWLESLGWNGFSIDREPLGGDWLASGRKGQFLQFDATEMDFSPIMRDMPQPADYLSIDVDADTLKVVERFPWHARTFKVATIEHNAYMDSGEMRDAIRDLMTPCGYELACADVCFDRKPFEDWWIHKSVFDPKKHRRITGKEHDQTVKEFFSE